MFIIQQISVYGKNEEYQDELSALVLVAQDPNQPNGFAFVIGGRHI